MSFDSASQSTCQYLLVRLAAHGDVVARKRVPTSELIPAGANRLQVDEIIDKLTAERILTSDAEGDERLIEVSHEALFQHWSRLTNLVSDTAKLKVLPPFTSEAERWRDQRFSDSFLLAGGPLASAKAWCSDRMHLLNELERLYLLKSMIRQESNNSWVIAKFTSVEVARQIEQDLGLSETRGHAISLLQNFQDPEFDQSFDDKLLDVVRNSDAEELRHDAARSLVKRGQVKRLVSVLNENGPPLPEQAANSHYFRVLLSKVRSSSSEVAHVVANLRNIPDCESEVDQTLRQHCSWVERALISMNSTIQLVRQNAATLGVIIAMAFLAVQSCRKSVVLVLSVLFNSLGLPRVWIPLSLTSMVAAVALGSYRMIRSDIRQRNLTFRDAVFAGVVATLISEGPHIVFSVIEFARTAMPLATLMLVIRGNPWGADLKWRRLAKYSFLSSLLICVFELHREAIWIFSAYDPRLHRIILDTMSMMVGAFATGACCLIGFAIGVRYTFRRQERTGYQAWLGPIKKIPFGIAAVCVAMLLTQYSLRWVIPSRGEATLKFYDTFSFEYAGFYDHYSVDWDIRFHGNNFVVERGDSQIADLGSIALESIQDADDIKTYSWVKEVEVVMYWFSVNRNQACRSLFQMV